MIAQVGVTWCSSQGIALQLPGHLLALCQKWINLAMLIVEELTPRD